MQTLQIVLKSPLLLLASLSMLIAFAADRRRSFVALFILTLAVRSVALPITVVAPDEYAFFLAAREVLQGHLPYLSFFDDKPVGSTVLLALAMKGFGASLLTLRFFASACVFLAAIGIYETTRRLTTVLSLIPFCAAALYIIYSITLSGMATMTEIILAPFTCAGVAFLITYMTPGEHGKDARLIMAAGLAFGLAVWIKTVPIVPAAVLGLFALAYPVIPGWRYVKTVLTHGMLYAVGVLLPTVLTALIYLLAGHISEFAFSNYGFMGRYIAHPSLTAAAGKLISALITIWPLSLCAVIGLLIGLGDLSRNREMPRAAAFLGLWLAAELAGAIAPLHMWAHYFLVLLPPLSIITAITLRRLIDPKMPSAYGATVVLLALVVLVPGEWASVITAFGRHDAQRDAAQAIERAIPSNKRSLLVLSYEFMADYVYTDSALPQKISLPPLMFGGLSAMVSDEPSPLKTALAAQPQLILLDQATIEVDAPKPDYDLIMATLAASYHLVWQSPDLRYLDTATYYGHNTMLFQHN